MEKILEVRDLKKSYNGFIAVNSISFDVFKAEIFGFLGPNGAGKTTTINMLIGLAKISEGKIIYRGMDLTKNIKKAQKIIGAVPDDCNLYNEMTGFENLCFCGALYGLPKKERAKKAHELLELFGRKEEADKKFMAYSRGMKRKLTIAGALVHQPEILFLDEPTTGIDVASVRQIRSLVKELNEKGMTIFLTTHYIEEAERLCNRVAFINKGEIIKIDYVEQLISETRETSIIEILFEPVSINKAEFQAKLNKKFPGIECVFKNDNAIKVSGAKTIDIGPLVNCLSAEGMFIYEARLIRPSLEDAFVKATGIEIDLMKKEKEKK